MADVDGVSEIVIASPIGRQEVTLTLASEGSTVTGKAQTSAELVDVNNGKFDGGVLTCSVDLRKPFPMTVTYTLTYEGDAITGKAKAGPFPASNVTGNKVS
ncbi:hypothetical protein [Humibacter ginsenosidimutans]|uniref:Uncharacterized protein n=1 Tax=Humibacter ginsenosidimutans TaxID=2599293 RepID=A0A5B8M0P2_9MICO|nr:hypothetical protein [Humibacter ginsenosidimutans]QDZ13601.1 hypothetical protein FPZ11_01210 [Humibacter ginsenosidimutans]